MLWRACFLLDLNGQWGECLGRVLPVSGVLLGCGIRVSAPLKGVGQRVGGYEQTAGRQGTALRETRETDGETL